MARPEPVRPRPRLRLRDVGLLRLDRAFLGLLPLHSPSLARTFFIDSLTHVFYYPSSAAQGFHWWEIDASCWALWLLERIRIVKGLRPAPSPPVTASALAAVRARLEAAGNEMAERALTPPGLPA